MILPPVCVLYSQDEDLRRRARAFLRHADQSVLERQAAEYHKDQRSHNMNRFRRQSVRRATTQINHRALANIVPSVVPATGRRSS